MKWSLLSFLFLSQVVFASPVIDEQLYVFGEVEQVKDLVSSGSVIVDHIDDFGFELYGPKGLKEHLDQKGIRVFHQKIDKAVNDYPSFEELTNKLQQLAESRPDIIKLFSIGKSSQGRDLWVMKISDNVEVDEVEPEFKYISSMHGDEIVGRELTMRLIEKIANEYDTNPEIKELVDNTEFFIMPSMNPDGSFMKRRANARRVDLNRNFPDIIRDRENTPQNREPETQAVMKFQAERNFSLSANFHGGSMVVNYPWDSTYERHPFNDLLIDLSLAYSHACTEMYSSRRFSQGITNGADWYLVRGGMQDWSSFWYDDLQLTIEVSDIKYPQYSQIESFWQGQNESMVNLMKKAHQGAGFRMQDKNARGAVRIEQTYPITRDLGTFRYQRGEYYKILEIGKYRMTLDNGTSFQVEVTGHILNDGNYVNI